MGTEKLYDVAIVGSGIGGLTAAALLAKAGKKVLVLEANYLPGGCCSSYWRKGYIFESGATTLMGFDAMQPMRLLQDKLGQELDLPMVELDPAMTVWHEGEKITRYKDPECWISEAIRVFGNEAGQIKFWRKALALNQFVWKVSGRNLRFPPTSIGDLISLATKNSPTDFPKLRYAFRSVAQVLADCGLQEDVRFRRFLDEQLLITAQNTCAQTPFLFAAPALCYTNAANYNLLGGMVQLPFALMRYLGSHGGTMYLRKEVKNISAARDVYCLTDQAGKQYLAKKVLSNIPIWNLGGITEGKLKEGFEAQAQAIRDYWGAFTIGIAIKDTLPADLTLHHQFILPAGTTIPFCDSHSVFVSLSQLGDTQRAPISERVLAVSTHARNPKQWFDLGDDYDTTKALVTDAILEVLEKHLPGFTREAIMYLTDSSPVTWQRWTFRHEGTVGGIPQSLDRPLYKWLGAKTADSGFFLCGDTVYPGQGVPGVALGGIIAAERILQSF